ncbi:MAG: L,D-transpeptidase family protein [Rhodobacteraceae bacterium]|nr:L,D-transpeptidase family protein [Paracoccaceae bacterium]
MSFHLTRRDALLGAAAGLAATAAGPVLAQSAAMPPAPPAADPQIARNVAGFRAIHWQDHFDELDQGVIIADTKVRALHYFGPEGGPALVFPTSVPISPELTRLGYTEVTQKVVGPSWRPTPSMRERNPDWPAVIGPGPDNPLGSHALYLSWPYYRIHGTHDVRKIGRPSSDGCIGLYNEQIAVLFEKVTVGTRVRLI